MLSIDAIRKYLCSLQNRICHALEAGDTRSFQEDRWTKNEGGGGITRILQEGEAFEKAGVNFSEVFGKSLPSTATVKRPELAQTPFHALGLSLVLHPQNPFVPTTHMNLRYFVANKPNQPPIWWFGGGFDLTPYYGFEEDCIHWHQVAKKACDPFGADVYPRLKKCCDDYFYLPHRREPRGIGGICFDDFNLWPGEQCFAFVKSVGDAFLEAYVPILKKRKDTPYDQTHRDFQYYRRGRYVEFNLLYDRGTRFGLQSGGRVESILMSLPPKVSWRYNESPPPGTREAALYTVFLKPRDWIHL